MAIFILQDEWVMFPSPELADSDGLLAIGGDLSIQRLLTAYSEGIFPWYNPGEIIQWWCPKDRFVIFPDEIHVSRSMRKLLKKAALQVKLNVDFPKIMKNCRQMREGETWITDEMEQAYNKLFEAGHAMCVAIYEDNILVGGLYGVVLGKCFFGESMFSKVPNASKLALIYLCETLAREGFVFVDCQFHTEHLEKMGGRYISWAMYKRLLKMGNPNYDYV